MTIQTVARRKTTVGTTTTHHLEIFCKNFRKIEFVIPTEAEAILAQERLEQFGLPGIFFLEKIGISLQPR